MKQVFHLRSNTCISYELHICCNAREKMSLHNFLKFQWRRHVKNLVFGTRNEALAIILDIFLENSAQ